MIEPSPSSTAPAPRPRRPVRAHLALPDSHPQIHKLTMGDEQIAEFKSMQVVQAKHIKMASVKVDGLTASSSTIDCEARSIRDRVRLVQPYDCDRG